MIFRVEFFDEHIIPLDLIEELVYRLRITIVDQGDFVWKMGDKADKIIFLADGVV